MTSTSPNTTGKRRNTLELKGGQTMATDEQIKQHKPELFDAGFYTERVQEELRESAITFPLSNLKSRLSEGDQDRFDAYKDDLLDRIVNTLSETPFEYDIQHGSEQSEDEAVTEDHGITVAVSNIETLLASVKQPIQDLENLHRLSALISRIPSKIERIGRNFPNFEEHNRRREVEIQALQGELNDLTEQEKEGGLTRSERIQKEQLEDEIRQQEQGLRKNQAKLKERKKRISNHRNKIRDIADALSSFLSEFDPENPSSFPESLNGERLLKREGIEPNLPLVHYGLHKILESKHEGKYTVYNPQAHRRQKLLELRQGFKKWAPRLAVILALAGGTYAMRDQIADIFDGLRSAKQEQAHREFRGKVEAAVKIVLLKRILMDDPYLDRYFNEAQKSKLLGAETDMEFLKLLDEFLPGITVTDLKGEVSDSILIEMDPVHIKVLKKFFGDALKTSLYISNGKDIIATSDGHQIVLDKIKFCYPDLQVNFSIGAGGPNGFMGGYKLEDYLKKEHCYGKVQDTKPLGFEGKFLMTDRTQPDTDIVLSNPYVTQEHREMAQKARGIEEISATLNLAVNDIAEGMASDGYEAKVNADKSLSEKERQLLLSKAAVFKNPFLSRYMEYIEKMMILYVNTEEELKDLLMNSVIGMEEHEGIKARLFANLFKIIKSNGGWPVNGVVKPDVLAGGRPTGYIRYEHMPEAVKAIRAEFGESIGLRFTKVVDGKTSLLVELIPRLAISLRTDFPAEEFCESEVRVDATATVLIPVIDKMITFKDRFALTGLDSIRENFCQKNETLDSEVEALKQEILFHPMIIRYVIESHVLDVDRDQFVAEFNTLETTEEIELVLETMINAINAEGVVQRDFEEISDKYSKILLMHSPTLDNKVYAFLEPGTVKELRKAFGENIKVSLGFSGSSEKVEKVDPFITNEIRRFGVTDEDMLPLTLAIDVDSLCSTDTKFSIDIDIPIGKRTFQLTSDFDSPLAGKCDLVEQIKR